ncbi:methionyl-tRNA formyltransferase [uncultured Oscillibacter sp.]|uniref:methionyl-tRNA formyltransferase n=1 Tax=uncultured Oscillibacter sp. TaxID=876091 RepID=UPI002627E33E|nr:methionyl-tRNA formyltransferase [uncultured Oscillibacter sp.]
MRILFMGTPEFAVASLRHLVEDGHEICGVFTQPDKPKNRGHKLAFSPVKEYALTKNLPVFQPVSLKGGEALELLRSLAPELTVVAAYGQLLPDDILNVPPLGSVNVHSSLLPRYRGAAPINWAILNGETETGVTIMYMARALDAGDIILQKSTPIGAEEDAQSLTERLAELGAEALSETVRALAAGTAARTPQDESLSTYAPKLEKGLSPIDWTRSAHEIACQVRGLIPWPCATTDVISGEPMKLYSVEELDQATGLQPGARAAEGKQGIDIACGDGKLLRVRELQAQGGKRMSAWAYLMGHRPPRQTNPES